jgi:hypothetical protein
VSRPCPSCATAVPEGGIFCPNCRLQVADGCAFCGYLLKEGWQHCPRCGVRALLPNALPCPQCSEPLWPSGIFCTECGAQVRPRCSGCGGPLMTDWDYCTGCGAPTPANQEAALEAYAAYRRALDLDPNELQARLNLGSLYAERERYEQAREEWERVIAVAPDSDEAREARDNLASLDEL